MAASSTLSYTLSCVPIRNKFSRHPVGCFCYALSRLALYLWRRTAMRLTNIRAINRRPFARLSASSRMSRASALLRLTAMGLDQYGLQYSLLYRLVLC